MAKKFVEPDGNGVLRAQRVPSGESHTFVARRLTLDHRYHDDDPVQNAAFMVKFPNGLELKGTLDQQGQASLIGVPEGGEVRYGPDQRAYERVDDRENPDHREQFTDGDFETLFAKYRG